MLAAAAPLAALDAVAVDTETTGLDPAKARIVQIAAVRIAGGAVTGSRFETLVAPGVPIPPASVAIHGVDDARVAGAPDFAAAWAEYGRFAGDAVLVGHNIAFDLAVIAHECRLAGLPFAPPRALDTALLAAVAEPGLPALSIEAIAGWLGVEVSGRHTADGDALTAARNFVALAPLLRRRGVRTLGEAEAACRAVSAAMAAAGRPAPSAPEADAARRDAAISRIDPWPFRSRVGDVMTAPARAIAGDRPLSEAIAAMAGERISSLLVARGDGAPPYGIVTERDVMRALAAGGAAALGRTAESIASTPLVTVGADDFVYRAIGRMTRRNIRHLAAVDAAGAVVGALSARDLVRLRSSEALTLGDAIATAADAPALASAFARVPAVARGLLDEGVAAIDVAAVVSGEIAAMTARAGELAAAGLEAAGEGPPPSAFALVVLGSAGRGESLLAPDQDNAIIHAGGDSDDPWFAAYGARLADMLDEAGVPYCKGGIMASSPAWRGGVEEWRGRIAGWLRRSRPEDLLNVDVFFDLAPASGDAAMADDLRREAYAEARDRIAFLKLLAEAGAAAAPPLTLFGGVRAEAGRVDLKKHGLFPIVAGARLLSIRYGVLARRTPDRLAGVRDLGVGSADDLDRLAAIHRLMVDLVLRQQLGDLAAGVPPSNRVALAPLPAEVRAELREALRDLGHLATTVRDLLFRD